MINGGDVGLLIAKNGVTGDMISNAGLKVREALSQYQKRIIVLTLDDLKSVQEGDQIKELLDSRYYYPAKYLK